MDYDNFTPEEYESAAFDHAAYEEHIRNKIRALPGPRCVKCAEFPQLIMSRLCQFCYEKALVNAP